MNQEKNEYTLAYLQEHVKQAEIRKGHIGDSVVTKCFLLMEEVGEMCKAIRILIGMKIHSKTAKHNLEDELGDVLFLIIAIANRSGIKLDQALLNKIQKDEAKVYASAGEKERDEI
jgi:NTP pyrophosphatase (non-canonical NTP hydrolase)